MRSRFARTASCIMSCAVIALCLSGLPAKAGSTGNLNGTITSADGAPVSGAQVSAAAPTASYKTTTDAHGFYSIVNMSPDTYTITVTATGYQPTVVSGVNVFQDQILSINATLQPEAKVLGRVTATATARTNLVQPSVTSDTYNVTAQQMNTILGDPSHHTLYDVLWRTPGVTSGPTSNSPIIRGGTTTEVGWEFEEIPIVDRTVGYYVTELSTTGISNVEVTTGGLSAQQGGSNGGIVNMVVKQGTYPSFGDATFTVGGPAYTHNLDAEYGGATPDNHWSWFFATSNTNDDQIYGNDGKFFFENVEGFDFVNTKDNIVNLHHHWGLSNQNDLQYVAEEGVGIFRSSYGGAHGYQLSLNNVFLCNTVPSGLCASLVNKGNADAWYHWYDIQKLSFSHTINDRSYYRARVAQSRNGYFFDELWAQNVGEPQFFAPGFFTGPGTYDAANLWCYGCYYQDRHTLQTFLNYDYANQLSDKHQIKTGIGYEFDTNYRAVSDCCTNLGFSGEWPSYDRVTKAPTHIYGAYLSDHIAPNDKWVFEPGVRWDMERYSISPPRTPTGQIALGANTAFSESFVSPRFAVTFHPDAADVYRASYEHLGQFIGTAYAENYTDFAFFGFGPIYHQYKPSTAKSYDFSWEHSFPNNVSLRITPYWHNNNDYIVEFRQFHGLTFFTNGGSTKTHGIEAAVSREVPEGLSTFFSFTYNDTLSNVLAAPGPYFGSSSSNTLANIQANNFLPATYAAPYTSNLALDYKHSGWEIDSNTTWSAAYPYGAGNKFYEFNSSTGALEIATGNSCVTTNQGVKCLDPAEANSFAQSLRSPGWYNENLYISHSVGQNGRVGMSILNLFNDVTAPVPSSNYNYLNTDSSGNWTPSGVCATSGQFPCDERGSVFYNVYLPSPNAEYYPAVGYYHLKSLTPRLVNFWYEFKM